MSKLGSKTRSSSSTVLFIRLLVSIYKTKGVNEEACMNSETRDSTQDRQQDLLECQETRSQGHS